MNRHNKTESVIDTENKQMFAEREGSEERKDIGEGDQRYRLSVAKQMSHGYETHGAGKEVNHYVISLHGWQTVTRLTVAIIRNIKSLHCVQGTNIGLQVNYTSLKKNKTN